MSATEPAKKSEPANNTAGPVDNGAKENQLSAKDLKALKKAEKAKKRAAQKEASGQAATHDPREQKKAAANQSQNAAGVQHANIRNGGSQENRSVALFSHLDSANGAPAMWDGDSTLLKGVHPSILTLALEFANYKITGSTARCRAMMLAFRDLITDYRAPEGIFSRNLSAQLSHQIDFLKTARPLSISMGNSIRLLKQEITTLDIHLTDEQAKEHLVDVIDTFIRDRLDLADQAIVKSAVQNINDGDRILTYARSGVVEAALLQAHKEGKKFDVVVVDSRPLFEGKKMVQKLSNAGLSCTYVLISALSYIMSDVTSVFVGAHAMLSNGLLYSRVGTAMVCTLAKSRLIPVSVLCESIKFSDKVQLDAVTFNELGPEKALLNISNDPDNNSIRSPLAGGKDDTLPPQLSLLNVMYDLTTQKCIKKIITELGSVPASSVPVVIREYKKFSE